MDTLETCLRLTDILLRRVVNGGYLATLWMNLVLLSERVCMPLHTSVSWDRPSRHGRNAANDALDVLNLG